MTDAPSEEQFSLAVELVRVTEELKRCRVAMAEVERIALHSWGRPINRILDEIVLVLRAVEVAAEWKDPLPWLYANGLRTAHKLPQTTAKHRPRTKEQYDKEYDNGKL